MKKKSQTVNRILIVKMSSIGDVVHALPFLAVIKKTFPGAPVDWLVEESASAIVKGHPDIERVLVFKRSSWNRMWKLSSEMVNHAKAVFSFFRELRKFRYDLIVDLQGLLKSGFMTGMAKGGRKVGMSGGREGSWLFLNEKPVPVDYDEHAIDRYLRVAAYLGCETGGWKAPIPVGDSDKKPVDDWLSQSRDGDMPLVAVNPMARWETKLWKPESFAELADRIQRSLSCRVVFTGGREDRSVIEDIISRMHTKADNLAGRWGLRESAYLYAKCTMLVSTDTGPMHMAAAMGCPVVALFGPTDRKRTGPYGKTHVVIGADLSCSPCFRKQCDEPVCMTDISVDRVFEAVQTIFKKRS
jgi:3-deoxy-D-manno-octulosonic-acid transferase/heptosyltransferase-1